MVGRRLVVVLLSLVVAVPAISLGPPPEPASADVCDVPLIGSGCEVGGWVGDQVGGGGDLIVDSTGVLTGGAKGIAGAISGQVGKAVSEAIEAGTKGVFDQLTGWVGTAAGWLFLKVVTLIGDTTSPNLLQDAFVAKYRQIVALAAILTVGVVSMAVVEGGRRGDVGQLVNMLIGALPLAVLGMVVGIAIVQLALNMVDTLSAGVAEATKSDIEKWFEAGAKWMVKGTTAQTTAAAAGGDPAETAESAAAATAPGFVLFISALLAVIGAFGLWLELLLRDAAIYVCSLFLPLGLAAAVWPRWSGVLRKTFEILIVLVVSKFFIVMVVSLAASFLGKPDGVESVLAGSAMMIVALLTPLMLMKVIPFMEGALLTSGAAGIGRSTVSTGSQVSMMRYHMGAIGKTGTGHAGATGSVSGGGSVPRPGGTPGSAAAPQGQSAAAGGRSAAGTGSSAAFPASQAQASESATQPVSTSGPVGHASTPRPVSVGDQQETSAPASAPDSAPPPASPTPSLARAPDKRESQSDGPEPTWQPSTAPEPKPSSEAPVSNQLREDGEASRPPLPDSPKPKRMGDG